MSVNSFLSQSRVPDETSQKYPHFKHMYRTPPQVIFESEGLYKKSGNGDAVTAQELALVVSRLGSSKAPDTMEKHGMLPAILHAFSCSPKGP